MRTGTGTATSDLEKDLRSRGMPLMLLPRARRSGLLARAAPAMISAAVACVAWSLATEANDELSAAIERADAIVLNSSLATFLGAAAVIAASLCSG